MMDKTFTASHAHEPMSSNGIGTEVEASSHSHPPTQVLLAPIPITVSPATPTTDNMHDVAHSPEGALSEKSGETREKDKDREKEKDKEKGKVNGLRVKRSISIDRGDTSKSKKVQQILKDRVHKGRAGISAVSRKIGHGVSKHHHLHLRRTNSSPGMSHSALQVIAIHI